MNLPRHRLMKPPRHRLMKSRYCPEVGFTWPHSTQVEVLSELPDFWKSVEVKASTNARKTNATTGRKRSERDATTGRKRSERDATTGRKRRYREKISVTT
ncbi:hypothetical protein E2C01_060867 [Portunus trituberculatus]|uniref:Uncharacterized protein n=1 Tax=Portunus trituberculatus TaxID=210409 RepID=A0A5B7HAT8_PORTR|nr:hypothetical protein [Portunus trituberculatus]